MLHKRGTEMPSAGEELRWLDLIRESTALSIAGLKLQYIGS